MTTLKLKADHISTVEFGFAHVLILINPSVLDAVINVVYDRVELLDHIDLEHHLNKKVRVLDLKGMQYAPGKVTNVVHLYLGIVV